MNRNIGEERRASPPKLGRRARAMMIAGHAAVAAVVAAAIGGPYVWPAQQADAGALAGELAIPANRSDTVSRNATAQSIVTHVRLSGTLPGLIGAPALRVSLPQGSTVNALLNALSGAYPLVDVMGPSMLIAVDGEAVAPTVVLRDGQVVELVMQMAGG